MGGLITGAAVAAAYVYPPQSRRTLIQVSSSLGLLAVFVALISWRTNDILSQFGPVLGHQ